MYGETSRHDPRSHDFDFSRAYSRVLGKGGLDYLAALSKRREFIRAHWTGSADILEAYAVLASWTGELAATIGEIESAIPSLSDELRSLAYAWLGHLYAVSGSRPQASIVLADAEARCSRSWLRARITQDRGRVALSERLVETAEQEFTEAARVFAACNDELGEMDAMLGLARAYSHSGRSSESLDMLLALVERAPGGGVLKLRFLLEIARTQMDRGDHSSAESLLDEARDQSPENLFEVRIACYFYRGELAWFKQNWAEAERLFREAISLCAAHARPVHEMYVYHSMAQMFFDAEQFDNALRATRRASELAEREIPVLVSQTRRLEACVLLATGKRELGLQAFRSIRPSVATASDAIYQAGMNATAELLLAGLSPEQDEAFAFDSAAAKNIAALVGRDEHGARWIDRTLGLRLLARRVTKCAATRNLAQPLIAKPIPIAVDVVAARIVLDSGEVISLAHRPVLWRVLSCLARRATERPHKPVSLAELIDTAWPNDQASPASLRGRLRVAVATLRQLGLDEALVTHDDGYSLTIASANARGADPPGSE